MTIELPATKHEFVGYAHTPVDVPDADGVVQMYRPQVWVREYPSVLVKSVKTSTVAGRKGGADMVTSSFTFDAASLGIQGFTNDFSASLREGTPAYDALLWAHQNRQPVYVAIETVRRWKSEKGDQIDPTTPIQELRGVTESSGGNANITKANCRNLVAAVAQPNNPDTLLAGEGVTDIAEWPMLRRNREGKLAPSGFRLWNNGVVAADTATASHGAAVSVEDIVAGVMAQLAPMLANAAAGGAEVAPSRVTEANPNDPRAVSGVAKEGKAWEPWNARNQLNMGGYLVTKSRYQMEWSVAKLGALGVTADVPAQARRLSTLVEWMTDQVHRMVVPVRPHDEPLRRTLGSWKESNRWVTFVIDKLAVAGPEYAGLELTAEVFSDGAARKAWAQRVIDQAAAFHADARDAVVGYLQPQQPAQQPAQPAQQPAQPAQQPAQQPGDGGAELAARWGALLARCPEAISTNHSIVKPYLAGMWPASGGDVAQVPADQLAAAIGNWETNLPEFIGGVREAHVKASGR